MKLGKMSNFKIGLDNRFRLIYIYITLKNSGAYEGGGGAHTAQAPLGSPEERLKIASI